ncbi:hypothetical protein GCM10027061_17800 [Nesterenkonia suensis]
MLLKPFDLLVLEAPLPLLGELPAQLKHCGLRFAEDLLELGLQLGDVLVVLAMLVVFSAHCLAPSVHPGASRPAFTAPTLTQHALRHNTCQKAGR